MTHGSLLKSSWDIAVSSAKNVGNAILSTGEFVASAALIGVAPAAVAASAGMLAGSAIGPRAALIGGMLGGVFSTIATAKTTLNRNMPFGVSAAAMLAGAASTAAIVTAFAPPAGL